MADPLAQTYLNARHEARIVLIVWFLALMWTVGYSYLNGYPHAEDGWLVQNGIADVRPVALREKRLGMPMWVCWGILAPTVCSSLFTLAFGLFIMRDDALGIENEEAV